MIITAIVTPQPDPSSADCEILLSYTKSLISELESVLNRLYEVSSAPDEAMVLIRNKVETMLSEAKTMQTKLNLIKDESVNRLKPCNNYNNNTVF